MVSKIGSARNDASQVHDFGDASAAMDGAKHSTTSATPFADSWASISAAAEGGIDQSAIEAANKALEEAMKKIDDENNAADDDDDVDEDGPADELESLCEAAMRLGMMDETTYDELTDAIASGALSERAAIDEWSRRLDVDTPSNYPDDEDAANVEVLAEDEELGEVELPGLDADGPEPAPTISPGGGRGRSGALGMAQFKSRGPPPVRVG